MLSFLIAMQLWKLGRKYRRCNYYSVALFELSSQSRYWISYRVGFAVGFLGYAVRVEGHFRVKSLTIVVPQGNFSILNAVTLHLIPAGCDNIDGLCKGSQVKLGCVTIIRESLLYSSGCFYAVCTAGGSVGTSANLLQASCPPWQA